MPQFTSAAQVRAAHPGAYDDLTDAQIEAGLARSAGPAPSQEPLGDRYMPGLGDDYTSAVEGELGRTAGKIGHGVLNIIPDTVSGVYNTVRHPLDTLMGVAHQVANPGETIMNLARNPDQATSLLGQMLLAPKIPGMANTALAEGPSLIGRGMSAVGRAAEAAGQHPMLTKAAALAPVEALTGHIPAAVVSAVTPPALEYGGRLLQRGGAALDGLDLSIKSGRGAAADAFTGRRPYVPQGTEIRDYGSELSPHETPTYERQSSPSGDIRGSAGLRGLQKAVRYATEPDAWMNDQSAQPEVSDVERTIEDAQRGHRVVEPNAFTGNSLSGLEEAAAPKLSPIEEFYRNDPQARGVGGNIAEGRMTGQFTEGRGGLSDVAAGRISRHAPPETPDLATDAGVDEGDAEAIRNLFNNYFGSKLAAAGKR